MAINRIGSVSLLNTTMREVTRVQGALADLQTQISSGKKTQNFAGLNGQVEQYTQLNAQLRRTEQYKSSNALSVSKLQTGDQALAQMINIADNMENMMVGSRNGATHDSINFVQQMRDLLNSMKTELNTSFNGHYIFGGTNTDLAPVPDVTIAPATQGIADDSYYAGSTDDALIRVDDLTTFSFPVRADDPEIQKVYAAAHLAMQAFTTNSDVLMQNAITMMQDGQKGLNGIQARVNTSVVNTNAITDRLNSLATYWKGLNDEVSSTDIVAASTQVSTYEAILQATFQVYARLSQLKLADYLR